MLFSQVTIGPWLLFKLKFTNRANFSKVQKNYKDKVSEFVLHIESAISTDHIVQYCVAKKNESYRIQMIEIKSPLFTYQPW